MKKISKVIIIIFVLLITACKADDKHARLISTNALKVNGNGLIVENGNIVVRDDETASNTINDNKSSNLTNDTNNNQSNNIKNNDSNEVSKPDEQMIDISITIDCKTILDNMSDLKNGYVDFIPKDGVILDSVIIKVKKNSTVLNVLETVNEKYDLNLKIRKSSFGVYIIGIKYIEEKICGNSSGWMYSVNDNFPGQNAGSYRLKDGDNIKWRFTCKPNDLK
ncbi:DUF4430 domain-containing protein [Thomasclavelia cocleata]|uniref:DUF4430 domain-containing protein n=1 Tax=Thomasclavelia cocleata TaxID=69824 RepID=UPI00248BD6E5|nr:DUF4430 domain-containing protein [Thomasclavelia cocleata]